MEFGFKVDRVIAWVATRQESRPRRRELAKLCEEQAVRRAPVSAIDAVPPATNRSTAFASGLDIDLRKMTQRARIPSPQFNLATTHI